ncbi:MAG: hypothetical protein ACJ72O_11015, partial [Marmoricola sp.]
KERTMKRTYQILAALLAVEVVLQAMAIAYGTAGLFRWVDKDGGVLNHAVVKNFEDNPPDFHGVGGFAFHGINGFMVTPLLALVFLVVAFFAKVEGGVRRAAVLFGMVILQVVLGMASHDVLVLAPLHALVAFGIFAMAATAATAAKNVGAPA